jgi:predicted transcriptional regulator
MKVLKGMNEIKNRVDLKAFAEMVGLNPAQTIEKVQELVDSGFVRKIGGGYGITDKGKAILNAITPVPKDKAFHFYVGTNCPTAFSAETLKDFYEIAKQIDASSLEFHLYRGDFENWLREAFNELTLAVEFAKIKNALPKGEMLRNEIIKSLEAKFGF